MLLPLSNSGFPLERTLLISFHNGGKPTTRSIFRHHRLHIATDNIGRERITHRLPGPIFYRKRDSKNNFGRNIDLKYTVYI